MFERTNLSAAKKAGNYTWVKGPKLWKNNLPEIGRQEVYEAIKQGNYGKDQIVPYTSKKAMKEGELHKECKAINNARP